MTDNPHDEVEADAQYNIHQGPPVITIQTVIVRLLIVISLIEMAIMLFLSAARIALPPLQEALLDACLLAILSVPFIYYWVIKPFVIARDIAEEHMRRLALYDPLTHLPNRRLLEIHLTRTIQQSIRDHIYGAVILLDLDGFKPINDRHGHEVGDVVLVEVARRIKKVIRQTDLPARLGGDEFVVLLTQVGKDPSTSRETALSVANKIRRSISYPLDFMGTSLTVDASVGVTLISPKTTSESVLRDADTAMYQAKKAGRQQVKMSDVYSLT